MAQNIAFSTDLKIAGVLSACTGLLGAATVPFLLPSALEMLPSDQRNLPLPVPVFCLILAVQMFFIYGLFALAGLRMSRFRDRDPAPILSAWISNVELHKKEKQLILIRSIWAFATGLLCGGLLVLFVFLIGQFMPNTLPRVMHPPDFASALLGSATASFGEEILCRLFLFGGLLRLFPKTRIYTIGAVAISSIVFGILHAPAAIFLFGGFEEVPILFWVWLICLNGIVGLGCAYWFLRAGIGGAILVHFGTDLIWHVLPYLV